LTPSEADKGKTIYRLKFVPDALKEWQTLDGSIKEPLRKLLKKRLEQPHMPGTELHGDLRGCYKIKLRNKDTAWSIWLRTMFLSSLCWQSTAGKIWRLITLRCLDCQTDDPFPRFTTKL
jgi:hypothetical protein